MFDFVLHFSPNCFTSFSYRTVDEEQICGRSSREVDGDHIRGKVVNVTQIRGEVVGVMQIRDKVMGAMHIFYTRCDD
jgi:hypothetical protein